MNSLTLYHHGIPIMHNPMPKTEYTIGSDPGNDLVLKGEGVAETHLVLRRDEDGRWISKYPHRAPNCGLQTVKPGTRIEIGSFAVELTEIVDKENSTQAIKTLIQSDDLGMAGCSFQMLKLRSELTRLAPLSAPVLITGETGTGKELAAKALHDLSSNSNGPFVAVNCGSLTPSMLEDILFGHERGSFTGAGDSHRGVFERAHGGSLFLDEVGELPQNHQAALLRVLDNGIVGRIGSEVERPVNFRLITATNRNLPQMVMEKCFRGDLYHRIATFNVKTPPLRERPEDIEAIARVFLRDMEQEVGQRTLGVDAVRILRCHKWLGNARELRNALYRAAALGDDHVLKISDFDLGPAQEERPRSIVKLRDLSDSLLLDLLSEFQGNTTALAKKLSVPRTTLRDRLRRVSQQEKMRVYSGVSQASPIRFPSASA